MSGIVCYKEKAYSLPKTEKILASLAPHGPSGLYKTS